MTKRPNKKCWIKFQPSERNQNRQSWY